MSGFVAEKAVGKLGYDFRPHVDSHGTSPEPSTDAVDEYRLFIRGLSEKAVAAAKAEAEKGPVSTADEQRKSRRKERTEIIAAVAKLLQDTPSAETLGKLPHRVLSAYNTWLSRELLDPTS